MKFPEDYPFHPPQFLFLAKIFHPNISVNGRVSVDILQEHWSPALLSFKWIIILIRSWLNEPNPDDFLNLEASELYKKDRKKYEETVKEYTSKFANYSIFQNRLKEFDFKIKYIDKNDKNKIEKIRAKGYNKK